MNSSVVIEHLLLSVLAWLAGLTSGSVLGYAYARLAGRLWAARPRLRRPAVVLPWRTVVVMAAAITLVYPYTAKAIGLGHAAGLLSIGVTVIVLALPFTAGLLLQPEPPSPLSARFIAGARTLALIAIAAAIMAYNAGAGGAGQLIWEGMNVGDQQQVATGFAVVALLCLATDFLLGLLQLRFLRS